MRLRSILLVSDFEATDFPNRVGLKREVVFIMRLRVGVLYHYIDSLPNITLLKINVPQQIDIPENSWGFEAIGQNLMGG